MTATLDESFAFCRSLARRTARNFYYSFLTVPARERRDMCVLYAFMRLSDDLGDDPQTPAAVRFDRLNQWRASLDRALVDAEFEHDVFPALADVVDRCKIPHEHLRAVIDGVRMDVEPKGFATFDELAGYCYHVAGVVGLCCIHVWGFHDDRAIERAVDCGCAFQLTNILRDLGEDAAMARVYLPQEDLDRFGYTAEDVARGCRDERFEGLMRFEIERARSYYRRAEELFEYLNPAGKPILTAMLRIYGGLLTEIERRNYDVFGRRVALPAWRKWGIVMDVLLRRRSIRGTTAAGQTARETLSPSERRALG